MPPEDEKPLTPNDRKQVSAWIRGDLTDLLAAKQFKDGRSKFRRLSRNEYSNTFEDLFGVRPPVGMNFPEDGRVDGFDKVAAALPLSAEGSSATSRCADDLLRIGAARPSAQACADKASRTVACRSDGERRIARA